MPPLFMEQPPVTESVRCNLCEADETKPLFRLRDYRLFVDDIEWQAVRCTRCGLGYLNPRPTPDELSRYYPAEYFSRRILHTARYARQADYVGVGGPRLLDVGTARGDFLAVMQSRGWEVEGIEPAAEAGNPHRLTIHRMRFPDKCDLAAESFDVITAWATFEHLRDPKRAFQVCARLLKPSGSLIVQVPNLRSIYSRWALQEDVPRHLYFFSPKTLQRYAEASGLTLTRVVQTTDLFGGSGRGALRLALVRAVGGSTSDFFHFLRLPRRERFRTRPLLATAWTATAAIERVLLTDWMVRRLRISGQVIAYFEKPGNVG
jgi:SAM-dependent methyltransferase